MPAPGEMRRPDMILPRALRSWRGDVNDLVTLRSVRVGGLTRGRGGRYVRFLRPISMGTFHHAIDHQDLLLAPGRDGGARRAAAPLRRIGADPDQSPRRHP